MFCVSSDKTNLVGYTRTRTAKLQNWATSRNICGCIAGMEQQVEAGFAKICNRLENQLERTWQTSLATDLAQSRLKLKIRQYAICQKDPLVLSTCIRCEKPFKTRYHKYQTNKPQKCSIQDGQLCIYLLWFISCRFLFFEIYLSH